MMKSTHDRETTMILILFATLIQSAVCDRLRCNPVQFAERGKPFVLTCNATHSVTDVYWYKGGDITDFPILVSENGNQRGKEYQRGEYELTSNFSLKIINTQLKHEGSYTVRTYFQDYLFEDVTTVVRVYDLPSPSCPYVDACGSSCNGCAINMTTSGYLVCYVNGSRPKFDIDWSVYKFVGISSAMQQQFEIYDETSDTWYTKRNISYNIDRCGTNATFHCTVNAPVSWTANILETYSISVQIISGDCQASISMEGTSPGKSNLLLIFLSLVGGGLFLLGLFFFVRYRIKKEKKKKILVTNLSIAYEKFCRVKPLPWEESISISVLYIPPKCTLTEENGNTDQIISSDLLEERCISRMSRAILIADFGNGKTSFTKYFVNKWITSQRNKMDRTIMDSFILIHVHLKDCKVDDLLPEIVKAALPEECQLTARDVDDILHVYDSIVVLSGLDEMSMSTRQIGEGDNNTEPTELACESHFDVVSEAVAVKAMNGKSKLSKLTIGNILTNTYKTSRYKGMKIWVTSSYFCNIDSVFVRPYSEVRLGAISEEDIKVIIRNTCRHYLESRGRGNEVTGFEKEVAKFIEINEIVKNFCETPLFLMMIVLSITSRLVNPEKYESVNFNQITTVMKLVMLCLQCRFLDKFQNEQISDSDIKELETRLGELALTNQCEERATVWEQKLGKVKTKMAKEIGFVKYYDKVELDHSVGRQSSFSGIMFCHEYFKEYLTARYLLNNIQDWDWLNKYIEMSEDESTARLLQFLCGLNHPDVHGMVKGLLAKQNMWNVFIDCLYEINDKELKKVIITEFKEKHSRCIDTPIFIVKYLERRYHKVALTDFFRICCEHDIKLSLMFQEKCSTKFVGEVTLPPLLSLVFADMAFDKEQYDSLVTSLTSGKRNIPDKLWFVCCKMPGNVEEHSYTQETYTSMEIQQSEEMPPNQPVVH